MEIRRVRKTFAALEGSDIPALDDISLHVPQGELTAIVGPSGSGKSTLLTIIAGLIPPSDGEVFVLDEPVRAPSPRVGLVFQTPVSQYVVLALLRRKLLCWADVTERTAV